MILRPLGLVCLCAALLLGVVTGVPEAAQAAEHRLGLVIGEAAYGAGSLATPANDAGLIAQALAADGFEVTGYADLDLAGTRRALSDFLGKAREAGPDAVAVVYLAGYGVQFSGDDFLVPVDARIPRDVDVPAEAVRLTDFSRDLAALPLKARVLVYDLARPHPFARGGTPLASGLAMVGPLAGSLVAFNTGPGLVAPAEQGDYGLYAQALAEMLQTKGLGIDTVVSRLRARIVALSNGAAVPWNEGTLDAPLVLLPPASDAPSLLSPFRALMPGGAADAYWTAIQRDTLPAYGEFAKAYPRDPLGARIATLLAARREATTWAQTRRAAIAAAYWTYMRRYPRGPHFPDARRGLAALPAALEPPPRFDLYAYTDLPAPLPDDLALINRPFVLLDADDDAPVPPPPATLVPERRTAFYDLLPPLLAVSKGTLPLPAPRGAAGPGRIVQPDFSGPGGPVVATEGTDKAGDSTVRQTGADGRLISTAIRSAAPNGGSIVTQTGPDNALVMKTVAVVGANGGGTVTQTGPDKQVIATVTTLVAAAGNRVTTVSGPDGLPRSIVTTTAAGVLLKPRGAEVRIAAPAASARPVVLHAATTSSAASAPPLLATGPGVQSVVAPPLPIAPRPIAPASSVTQVAPSQAAPAPQQPAPPIIAPRDVVAPSAPTIPTIVPTIVPELAVPAMTPMAMPTIVAPEPSSSATVPAAPAPALKAPQPDLRSAPGPAPEPKREQPAVSEPVPPRKGPEPAAAGATQPPEAHHDKPATALSQPTPPQRPKAAPAKVAPPKVAKPAKASSKAAHGGGKPAPKKAPAPQRAPGKHRG
ncbi:caspase family protein [Beijerinckia sp. L45]|uniref:caspase family protein n=1 Tax=Beijerinckia sp. L45 TaxID=1641855 RepID=UPI00131C6985|nr:caspase family protein [Beijerinckia sp. L45]